MKIKSAWPVLNDRPSASAGYGYCLQRAGNDKPSVLLLTQVLPFPADAGPKIKTLNLIKYLAKEYRITLVSFTRDNNTPDHAQALLEHCEAVYLVPLRRSRVKDIQALFKSLFSPTPFLIVRDRSAAMSRLLTALTKNQVFRVVHADQLNMAQYALAAPVSPKVLDQHNAVFTISSRLSQQERNPLKRYLLKLESKKLKRYEQLVCRQFDTVLAVNQRDAEALATTCSVIPIGVDAEATDPINLEPGSYNLLSLGTMFYPPNAEGALWFGRQVFPLIRAREPRATFTITGPRPPARILAMAREIPGVRVTGYVEDLRPLLESSAGLVVPLLSGSGMRVKILEALAYGLPVVSTSVGAEGIELKSGYNALLADNPQEFAEACLRLLSQERPGPDLALAGRQLALEVYDFRRAYRPLSLIYKNLTGSDRVAWYTQGDR